MSKNQHLGVLTPAHPAYSPLLNQVQRPPNTLYYRGDVSLLKASRVVAVVGSRRPSRYGLSATADVVAALMSYDAVVVSGLAFGIDAAAHQETLTRGGRTIAVLGSPVDDGHIHPSGNRTLANAIVAQGGLLLSEYPLGYPVQKHHFPARNRIIAGLSHATVVVEASERSGALITARAAADCSREVFTVPGSIYSSLSHGCNALIDQGAIPFTSCHTIGDTLEYHLDYSTHTHDISSRPSLTLEEAAVVRLFSTVPASIDEVKEATTLSIQTLLQCVTTLLLYAYLKEVEPQRYVRTH